MNQAWPQSRRTFLLAGGLPFFGVNLAGRALAAPTPTGKRKVAKSANLIWLSSGASHIDTWDMKPDAPVEYRSTFKPIPTSAPGIQLCEHLPHLAKQAHQFAIVRSLGDHRRGTGDHHAGYYYNLTGHAPDRTFHQLLNARTPYATDWPSMASVVASKGPPLPNLPSAITLPQKKDSPHYTRPRQFAARLGIEFDPVFVDGSREKPLDFLVPALALSADTTVARLQDRRSLLGELDRARGLAKQSAANREFSIPQRKAFTLLASKGTRDVFDLRAEPASARERYGPGINAMSMLLARRLVEAGVPIVQANMGQMKNWDTHNSNFKQLKDRLLPPLDQGVSALLDDLNARGLLDETLVVMVGEFGRTPKLGGNVGTPSYVPDGRDHWSGCVLRPVRGGRSPRGTGDRQFGQDRGVPGCQPVPPLEPRGHDLPRARCRSPDDDRGSTQSPDAFERGRAH
jgi:hypothetical protein